MPIGYLKLQAPVVQKVDSAIHQINLYALDSAAQLVSPILFHRVAIYLVDSAIHLLNNRGQICRSMFETCHFIAFMDKKLCTTLSLFTQLCKLLGWGRRPSRDLHTPFLKEKVPAFHVPSTDKWYPFLIPSLELSICSVFLI